MQHTFEYLRKELISSVNAANSAGKLIAVMECFLKKSIEYAYPKKRPCIADRWTDFIWSTRTYNRIKHALTYINQETQEFEEHQFLIFEVNDISLAKVAQLVTKKLLISLQGSGTKTFEEIEEVFSQNGLQFQD